MGNRGVAEDILQEAFVHGMKRVSTLRDGEALVPWFFRVLRNAVVDHHRRSVREQARMDAREDGSADLESDPEAGR